MCESPVRVDGGTDTDRETKTFAPATLLGDDIEIFEKILTDQSSGSLAVCSPPFGGREPVLEYAADQLGTDLLRLGPGDGAELVLSALEDGPVVIDGCQHLYERRIGGFEPLETVLRAIVTYDDVVVAGWNTFAWTYLAQIRGIDRTFANQTEIESTAATDLAELVLERYDEIPEFTADQANSDGLFAIRRYEIDWRGSTFSLPVPILNRATVKATLNDGDVDPKDVVFERLAAVSQGNVGVATAIWETSRRKELRPSDIVASGTDLDLDREEAFCLRIILLKERVTRAELTRILDDTDRVLGRLLRDGMVAATDGDIIQLEPTAVPTAVSETERRSLH